MLATLDIFQMRLLDYFKHRAEGKEMLSKSHPDVKF